MGFAFAAVKTYLSIDRKGLKMADDRKATETRILDLAENLIRTNGYNGFSFRDIASGIGVKSASVHYHFPTKGDLGARVARRYSDRFLEKLGDPENASDDANSVVDAVRVLFREALLKDGQMCLCGMLAAESAGLPDGVVAETRDFFDRTTEWLMQALARTAWGKDQKDEAIRTQALRAMALFEGGLLIARAKGEPDLFDAL
jgi:TetR/AcrR family transcriptional repressor of nem operon